MRRPSSRPRSAPCGAGRVRDRTEREQDMPELVMPKMGDAMEEGTIVRWLKNEGDQVAEQEVIAEIATEKANIEIPATDAGVLSRILVKENETVPVGTPIAVIGNGKETAAITPARS